MSPAEVESRTVNSSYLNSEAMVGNENSGDLLRLKEEATTVFKRSAKLTPKPGIYAEYFDNKVTSFMTPVNPKGAFGIAYKFGLTILPDSLNWALSKT